MNTLIIYDHPYEGSYNKAILDQVIKALANKKEKYKIIDLHKDNFNPVFKKEELKDYSNNKTIYELASKYKKLLKEANKLIIIHPIWWGMPPATIKGFYDKVLVPYFAFGYMKLPFMSISIPKGKMKWIKNTYVINTATTPNFLKIIHRRSCLATWKTVKTGKIKWLYFGGITSTKDIIAKRKKFLNKIYQTFSN